MSKERGLPRPPKKRKPFRKTPEPETPLLSEEMEIASAQGRLDEFLKERIPDNEYAQALARMAAGMSGLDIPSSPVDEEKMLKELQKENMPDMPEAILGAAQSGDLKGLMEALAAEHEKRTGRKIETSPADNSTESSMETEILDSVIKIAAQNNLTIDWLVTRALKLYVEEHKRTGKL